MVYKYVFSISNNNIYNTNIYQNTREADKLSIIKKYFQ